MLEMLDKMEERILLCLWRRKERERAAGGTDEKEIAINFLGLSGG